MKRSWSTFIPVVLGLALATACGGGKFAGGSGGRKQDQGPESPGGNNPASPTLSNPNNKTGVPGATPTPGALNSTQTDCLLKKADKYNILLVFDNSNSTKRTDPSNVRQQGALQFTKKFIDFASANPTADIKIGVIRFSESATRGSHGWMKLAAAAEQDVTSDIIMATTNQTLSTRYKPATDEAQRMMADIGATGDKRQRNYMIFMSDGRPTDISDAKAPDLFDPIVNSNGTAIFSIALPTANENTMTKIAKPDTGVVSPKHVGLYLKAESAGDLLTAYSRVADVISGCE